MISWKRSNNRWIFLRFSAKSSAIQTYFVFVFLVSRACCNFIEKSQVAGGEDGVARTDTCGMCGLNSRCANYLRKGKSATSLVMVSTCTFAPRSAKCEKDGDVDISVARSRKGSTRNPCTNLPLKCELCKNGDNYVWKYHMRKHIDEMHGGQMGISRGGTPGFKESYLVGDEERKAVTNKLREKPRAGDSAKKNAAPKKKKGSDAGASASKRPRRVP